MIILCIWCWTIRIAAKLSLLLLLQSNFVIVSYHSKGLFTSDAADVNTPSLFIVLINRLSRCRVCQTELTAKSISCVCWITTLTLTYACWSLSSSWWWKGHCVFIVRSNGGSRTALLRQLISGCLCPCAQWNCFNRGLIHLVILLKLMRYTHICYACYIGCFLRLGYVCNLSCNLF